MLASAGSPQNATGRYVLTCKKEAKRSCSRESCRGCGGNHRQRQEDKCHKSSEWEVEELTTCMLYVQTALQLKTMLYIAQSSQVASIHIFVSISIAIHNLVQLRSHLPDFDNVNFCPEVPSDAKSIVLRTHTKFHYIALLKQST